MSGFGFWFKLEVSLRSRVCAGPWCCRPQGLRFEVPGLRLWEVVKGSEMRGLGCGCFQSRALYGGRHS